MLNNLSKIKSELNKLKNSEKAKVYQQFFKTGKGQYGAGDIFFGLSVPEQREIAKKYLDLKLIDIQKLLDAKIHEHRMTGLLILVYQFEALGDNTSDEQERKKIFNFYIKNAKKVNNWDLVDVTCPRIVGKYLVDKKDRKILYKLANSKNLWEKRISIVSTWWFIRDNQLQDTINISETLLNDQHDLIHKAVGWMLREVGKKNVKVLEKFLNKNIRQMSRTMLRYSIEKFPKEKRKVWLKK